MLSALMSCTRSGDLLYADAGEHGIADRSGEHRTQPPDTVRFVEQSLSIMIYVVDFVKTHTPARSYMELILMCMISMLTVLKMISFHELKRVELACQCGITMHHIFT